LNPDEYEEEEAFVVSPKDNPLYNKGMHTISCVGDFIAVDAKNHKFVRSEFVRKLKLKLGR